MSGYNRVGNQVAYWRQNRDASLAKGGVDTRVEKSGEGVAGEGAEEYEGDNGIVD